jgi:hypothetical protein
MELINGNTPGWIALILIVLDRVVVPVVRSIIPAKEKQADRQENREDLKLQHEIETQNQLMQNLQQLTTNQIAQTEILREVKDVQRELKVEQTEIKEVLLKIVPVQKRKPTTRTRKGDA